MSNRDARTQEGQSHKPQFCGNTAHFFSNERVMTAEGRRRSSDTSAVEQRPCEGSGVTIPSRCLQDASPDPRGRCTGFRLTNPSPGSASQRAKPQREEQRAVYKHFYRQVVQLWSCDTSRAPLFVFAAPLNQLCWHLASRNNSKLFILSVFGCSFRSRCETSTLCVVVSADFTTSYFLTFRKSSLSR